MKKAPLLIVNAYNRPQSLRRLLGSIDKAAIPENTDLLISIDKGGPRRVLETAKAFRWDYGRKEVRLQEDHLGLVGHFYACGDVGAEHGDFVYLEDDLYLSPGFFHYASRALDFYRGEAKIGGISLNSLSFNGYTHTRFEPLPDAGDAFFLQVFWYQGQVFSAQQWRTFKAWSKQNDSAVRPEDGLHPVFIPNPRWQDEFFPAGMKYLNQENKFFVFPRQSLAVNFGDPGTHFKQPTGVFQSPLHRGSGKFRFQAFNEASGVYDSYFELLPEKLGPTLKRDDFDVDLNASKPDAALTRPLTLTTRRVRQSMLSFGLELKPPEMNILDGIEGNAIHLAQKKDVHTGLLQTWLSRRDHMGYFRPNDLPLRKKLVTYLSKFIFR